MYETPAPPFQLQMVSDGSSADLEWTSKMGKFYDLVSSTNLSTPQDQWLPYSHESVVYEDLHTSGLGSNAVLGLPVSGQTRGYSVHEKNYPAQ